MHGVPDSGLKAKFDVLATNVLSPSIKEQKTLYKGQDGLNTISGATYTAILMGSFSFTACWFFFACNTLHTARKKNTKFICDKIMEVSIYAAICIHVNFIYITEHYSYYHVTSAFSSTFSNCQSICADDFLCMIVDVSCIPATTSLGISILFLNRNPQMKLKYL